MSILDLKIKELIDELNYTDKRVIHTDRKSIEFIMNEVVDFVLAIVVLPEDIEINNNIRQLKK